GRGGLAILNFGPLLPAALAAADELDATVIDMRLANPLDREAVLRAAERARALVALEENVDARRAGPAATDLLAEAHIAVPVLTVGIPARFIEHGSREDCLQMAGLDAAGIRARITQWWRGLASPTALAQG